MRVCPVSLDYFSQGFFGVPGKNYPVGGLFFVEVGVDGGLGFFVEGGGFDFFGALSWRWVLASFRLSPLSAMSSTNSTFLSVTVCG